METKVAMNKRLIIITGASSGIGAALAKTFSAAGYALGLLSRNLGAMEKLNLPETVCQSVDVTEQAMVADAIRDVENKLGPVDCLINNAGYLKHGAFHEIISEDHAKMVNVNLLGVINGIESVLSGMQERMTGTIINISSLADRNSRPKFETYAATKAAVKSLSESLRMANAKNGIRICNIAPANILTEMSVSAKLDPKLAVSAEDFAKTVLWIYQQPQNICIRDLVFSSTYYEP
jgi:NADP-dependent 3-hydroxy acid dehydrogenase YdfG